MISMRSNIELGDQVRLVNLSRDMGETVSVWLGVPDLVFNAEKGSYVWTGDDFSEMIGALPIDQCRETFGVVPASRGRLELSVDYTENLLTETISLLLELQKENACAPAEAGPPVDYIELNMGNYSEEDVSQLNQWGTWASNRLDELDSALIASNAMIEEYAGINEENERLKEQLSIAVAQRNVLQDWINEDDREAMVATERDSIRHQLVHEARIKHQARIASLEALIPAAPLVVTLKDVAEGELTEKDAKGATDAP